MTDREKKRREAVKAALIAEWNRQAQAAATQAAGAQAEAGNHAGRGNTAGKRRQPRQG